MRNVKESDFIFVIPYWSEDAEVSNAILKETIQGIFTQTDERWRIVIIDNASVDKGVKKYLDTLLRRYPNKIHVIHKDRNEGPGMARNLGIKWAYDNGYPVILFNDADDISDRRRVELVRESYLRDENVSVVYSKFEVIDDNSRPVPKSNLTSSILEILEALENDPPQGDDAWIEIGTRTGYVNLTSATAVKTLVAYRNPFPGYLVSEDQHTWLRYSAYGGKFVYRSEIPSLYRIPANSGSSTRKRIENYYEIKAKVDTEGFYAAINLALLNGRCDSYDVNVLLHKFFLKLAHTLYKEHEKNLARNQIIRASKLFYAKTEKMCVDYGMKELWDEITV